MCALTQSRHALVTLATASTAVNDSIAGYKGVVFMGRTTTRLAVALCVVTLGDAHFEGA